MRLRRRKSVKWFAFLLFAFAVQAIARADNAAESAVAYDIRLPLGISVETWSYYVPRDNPLTAAKVDLGRQLFFDKQLSADGTVSCSSCHDPKLAFADGRRVSEGIHGRLGMRNSPSILNAMFNSGQFWDGRADSLEAQATQPLLNADEMGNASLDQVVERLQKVADYDTRFRQVFHTPVTAGGIARAIAAFERTLVAADSPFDRFNAGDREAMSEAARRGLLLYRTKARCNICHNLNSSFPFMTDNNYRNTGVAANFGGFDPLTRSAVDAVQTDDSAATLKRLASQPGGSELGRFAVTGNPLDIGAFRTPSLRNVELTGPYFHDGSAATLEDVLRYYLKGGNENALRDWELQALMLSDDEQKDLIEFLKSLTSDQAKADFDGRARKPEAESTRNRGQR